MTGLSLETDALVKVAALVTGFENQKTRRGVDLVIRPRPGGAGTDERCGADDAYVLRPARQNGARRITLDEACAQVMAYVRSGCPSRGGRRWREYGGHRSRLPGARYARAGRLAALPDRRRLLDQGEPRAGGSPGLFNAPAKRAATGPWPTSASRSPSCATTAGPSSSRSPARTRSRPAQSPPACRTEPFASRPAWVPRSAWRGPTRPVWVPRSAWESQFSPSRGGSRRAAERHTAWK